ncbi:MAG: hypothetical protein NT030_08405 [Candidatus Saganbacteria bacterium]|nr:hypothetical protein [Candidatus Saganbacteria bacterium]
MVGSDMTLPTGKTENVLGNAAADIRKELNDATGLEDILAAVGKAQDFMIDSFCYVDDASIINSDVATNAAQMGLTGSDTDKDGKVDSGGDTGGVYAANALTGEWIKADRLDGSVRIQDFNESVMNITSNATSVEQTKKAAAKKVDQLTG